jgi:hypothetical protein
MSESISVSILVSLLVSGCGAGVQGGLANAPTLADATPETRVHDAIANGRDSCERSAFPPGEVLRGHVPPCVKNERTTAAPTLLPSASHYSSWISAFYPASVCQTAGPGLVGAQAATGEGACRAPL